MQAVVRSSLLVGVLLCACHVTSPAAPDAGGSDGSGAPGLSVSWAIQPAVPGPLGTEITIDDVGFHLASLRITGDAGSVSTSDSIQLEWKQGEAPQTITFPSAPTGLYSKVSLRIDGELEDNSYWINGHATVNGTTYPFKIYDLDYLDVPLQIDTTLEPGGSATVPIEVDLGNAVSAIDFSQLSQDDGTLTLSTLDSYMPTFRANLTKAFVIAAGSQ